MNSDAYHSVNYIGSQANLHELLWGSFTLYMPSIVYTLITLRKMKVILN